MNTHGKHHGKQMPRYSAAAAPDADVPEAGDDATPVLVETVTMELAGNKVDLTAHLRTI